ncbi:uncharacterized protein [Branchiostoma lanceolatum]|uniref:uncharacterized protein n=1 Tax=Branchiostoma lanceolatum TaxID=7740 RepID=UPI003455BD76
MARTDTAFRLRKMSNISALSDADSTFTPLPRPPKLTVPETASRMSMSDTETEFLFPPKLSISEAEDDISLQPRSRQMSGISTFSDLAIDCLPTPKLSVSEPDDYQTM